jgi:hypothetical protein
MSLVVKVLKVNGIQAAAGLFQGIQEHGIWEVHDESPENQLMMFDCCLQNN